MSKKRADLGFADTLDEFNPAEWKLANTKANDRLRPEDLVKAAEGAGFRSREPKSTGGFEGGGQGHQRRRRTGRNAQFNLKARRETIEAYCAIADAQGWGLGETLERAVELLEAQYGSSSPAASCVPN